MAAHVNDNACVICGRVCDANEYVITAKGQGKMHAECARCGSCGDTFKRTRSRHNNDLVMLDDAPFHPQCILCNVNGCDDPCKHMDCVKRDVLFCVTGTGPYYTISHAGCHGCQCAACDEDAANGMPRSGYDDLYSFYHKNLVRRYGDTVLAPHHRACTRCNAQVGRYGEMHWNVELDVATLDHPTCLACGLCSDASDSVNTTDGAWLHKACMRCAHCNDAKYVSDMSRRHFIKIGEDRVVHSDCEPCAKCGVIESGRYVRWCRLFPGESGWEGYVHYTCPRGSKKRSREEVEMSASVKRPCTNNASVK